MVLDGCVRVREEVPGAGKEAMHFAQAGDFFGEVALIDDLPRSATAVAHEPCRVFVVPWADFLDLTSSDPAPGSKVLRALCPSFSQRLREATERNAALFAISRAM